MRLYGIVDKLEIEPGEYELIRPIQIPKTGWEFAGDVITNILFPTAVVVGKIIEKNSNQSKNEESPAFIKRASYNGEYSIKLKIEHFYSVNQIKNISIMDKNSLKLNDTGSRYSFLSTLFNTGGLYNKIMKECTELLIYERNYIPEKFQHYGGENGIFSHGLYCVHPKNENILIPLKKYPEIIQNLISEEIVQTFEKLGAKSIIIRDVTKKSADAKANFKDYAKADFNFESEKEFIAEKRFGKRPLIPLDWGKIYFLPDYLRIMTIIKSRETGNQIYERFQDSINININLSIDVLQIFEIASNFNYKRLWEFEVEFYDKNE